MSMENLNFIIAKNLTALRKQNKLTQLEVAEKLNYSDKAVSKWEQGESLPPVEVLYKLSRLYNVSLEYLVSQSTDKKHRPATVLISKNRRIITMLAVLAVWFAATVLYSSLNIIGGYTPWMVFCWAVPASFIVALIFVVIWHRGSCFFIILSLLLWTMLLCLCLQFFSYNMWVILIIGAPLQAATLLWAWLVKK